MNCKSTNEISKKQQVEKITKTELNGWLMVDLTKRSELSPKNWHIKTKRMSYNNVAFKNLCELYIISR